MADQFDDLIVLTDENGEESTWEHIVTFELDGNTYVALQPIDGFGCDCDDCHDEDCDCDDEDEEAWLLKLVDEDGEQAFALIEDEDEYNAAADEYMRICEEMLEDEASDEE